MKIGFIGTGIMGSRMAANLMAAGHELVVHNRTQSKADELIAQGATWAETPADAAQNILFTMLAHPEAVEDVALHSETGFLPAMPAGSIWIDCSTVNPSFARWMAQAATEKGIRYVDAPVGGSKSPAQEGQLVFLVGGDADDVEEIQPLLEVMGRAVNHIGGHGMGNALKLVLNHLLATSMMAFAEGLILGEALGIDQERLLNVLVGGPLSPPYVAGKRSKLETGDFEVEFPLRWMQKDTQMVAQAAFEMGVSMPASNVAKELYQLAVKYGYGDDDFSAIYAFLKK